MGYREHVTIVGRQAERGRGCELGTGRKRNRPVKGIRSSVWILMHVNKISGDSFCRFRALKILSYLLRIDMNIELGGDAYCLFGIFQVFPSTQHDARNPATSN